ncbi:MAG: hypothetical protein WC284_16985 [Candidimonas sp.]
MANIKNFGLIGIGSNVQYGKAGGKVNWNSGDSSFELFLADGVTRANLRVATPLNANDAATKSYVDNFALGLDIKASVRVATTTSGTLSTSFAAGQVIDDITLVLGDRILIKNQVDESENGIYVVTADTPTRSDDFADSTTVTPGAFMFVEEGTTNADTGWVLITDGASIDVGVDDLVFTQFTGATTTITAGNGIAVNGNEVSANVDGVTITNTGGTGDELAVLSGADNTFMRSNGTGTDAVWAYVSNLYDSNGNLLLEGTATGSAVNYLTLTNSTTGNEVIIGVDGTDTNVDLLFTPKGDGYALLPSGYDLTLAPDNAIVTKGYLNSLLGSSSRISDTGDTTFVDTEYSGIANEVVIGAYDGSTTKEVARFAAASGAAGGETIVFTHANGEVVIEAVDADSTGDVDIRLVPQGNGQVFIGEAGDGVIQADDDSNLTVKGGANAVDGAGDLILGGGDGGATGGNVFLRGGDGTTDGSVRIQNADGSEDIIQFVAVGSAVNSWILSNSATGDALSLTADGTDTNIDIALLAKGDGLVVAFSGYDMSTGPDYAFATKGYVDSVAANASAGSVVSRQVSFDASGDSFPLNVGTTIVGRVTKVKVEILTALNQVMTVGITGNTDELAVAADIDETEAGINVIETNVNYATDTQLVIDTTATSGTGYVIIEYIQG